MLPPMRATAFVPFVVVTLVVAAGCDDGPSPEQKRNAAIREQIQQTISQIEAKSRTKAQSLGMATAQTAPFEDVKAFVCEQVIESLKGNKAKDDRAAVADDLAEYDCRGTESWLQVLQTTAKRQGLDNAGAADLSEARSFVCRRIKESLRAVRERDKDSLIIEAKVYDCVL